MNIINQAMLFLLNALHDIVHSYGLAIVLLTVLIRAVLWPLNSAQTRSMRKMQELQPKLKALQEKYKDNPQKMQEAMMKFYKEYNFNPMAGCLPLLVQLPIFIGLYGALSSPQFLAETVNENFLGLTNLSKTLQSHAGKSLDGTFNVEREDYFTGAQTVTLTYTDGKTVEQAVRDPNALIHFTPKPLRVGYPVRMVLDLKALDLSEDYKSLIRSVNLLVINGKSREMERIHFDNVNGTLTQEVPTAPAKSGLNPDVLVLIVIYATLTLLYQQMMTGKQPKPAKDDPAAAMQSPAMKMMPLMFVVMMFFFPIPAGAMIYLVVTTALMLIQTMWVNFGEDRKNAAKASRPSDQVVDIKADRA